MSVQIGDFHSHLLPNVDDGSRTVEDALEGVGRMVAAGVSRIITTPHLKASVIAEPDECRVRMDDMDEAWAEVEPAVASAHEGLRFERGFEVMLDIPDPDLSDPRFHLAGTRFVLVEWPRLQIPPGTAGVVERLVQAGLIPIIAHPERYMGVERDLLVVQAWKEAGAFLQGNHGSLVGMYGAAPERVLLRLLEVGMVDYLSSDFHGRPEYKLHIQAGCEVLERMEGIGQLELLTSVNPGRLFEGEDPLAVPPLHIERGLWHKVRGWLGS